MREVPGSVSFFLFCLFSSDEKIGTAYPLTPRRLVKGREPSPYLCVFASLCETNRARHCGGKFFCGLTLPQKHRHPELGSGS